MLLRKPSLHQNIKITHYLELAPSIVRRPKPHASTENTEEYGAESLDRYQPITVNCAVTQALGPCDRDFYERWKSVINNHFFEPDLSVAKLARLSYLSQRQLFNKVKGVTGRSPKTWLNEFRIRRAKKLLCTEAVSILKIAEDTGFSSASHFSKTFRKIVGMAPSTYRRNAVGNQTTFEAIQ